MAKRVKIPGRLESAETGNIVTGADAVMDDAKGKTQVVINSEVDAAIINLAQGKQDNLTFDSAPTEDSPNPVTSAGVYTADKVLSDAIEAILLLIPSAASALNKLVDMQTMNSSIATATASFKGTYNLVSDLHLGVDATHEQIGAALDALSLGADNNDYAFVQVPNSATAPTEISKTERYKFNGTNWLFEYDLNNSGFTQGQWNAINSGVTSLLVGKLSDLPTNTELTNLLAGKQDNLTFDNVPTAGSPNPVKSGGVYARNNEIVALINALDAAKQDVLTFDNTPTEGSSNPVKSGGVYLAISALQETIVALDAAKQNVLTFDNTPTLGSQNPVTSSGIKNELDRIDGNITTLNDLYEALTQSALVIVQPTDTWPVASPATKTIYRVVDRVNTPPQNYSDYMWNGSTMVLMATYDNAIDDKPTPGSNNLVKSGGVADEIYDSYGYFGNADSIYRNDVVFCSVDRSKQKPGVVKAIRFAYGNGPIRFYKVSTTNASILPPTPITEEMTFTEAGEKTIPVNVVLGDGDYIGVSGRFAYQGSGAPSTSGYAAAPFAGRDSGPVFSTNQALGFQIFYNKIDANAKKIGENTTDILNNRNNIEQNTEDIFDNSQIELKRHISVLLDLQNLERIDWNKYVTLVGDTGTVYVNLNRHGGKNITDIYYKTKGGETIFCLISVENGVYTNIQEIQSNNAEEKENAYIAHCKLSTPVILGEGQYIGIKNNFYFANDTVNDKAYNSVNVGSPVVYQKNSEIGYLSVDETLQDKSLIKDEACSILSPSDFIKNNGLIRADGSRQASGELKNTGFVDVSSLYRIVASFQTQGIDETHGQAIILYDEHFDVVKVYYAYAWTRNCLFDIFLDKRVKYMLINVYYNVNGADYTTYTCYGYKRNQRSRQQNVLYRKKFNSDVIYPEYSNAAAENFTENGLLINSNTPIMLNKYYGLQTRVLRLLCKFSGSTVAKIESNEGDSSITIDTSASTITMQATTPITKNLSFFNVAHEYMLEITRDYNKNKCVITDINTSDSETIEHIANGTGGVGGGSIGVLDTSGAWHDYYQFRATNGSFYIKEINVSPLYGKVKTLIYGDSVTELLYFPQTDYAKCWTQQFIAACANRVMVSPRGGSSIAQIFLRIVNELPFIDAEYVMVTIGTNSGVSLESFSQLVEYIFKCGATPVLNHIPCNINGGGVSNQVEINAMIDQIREKYGIHGVDFDIATSIGLNGQIVDTTKMWWEDYPEPTGSVYHHPNVKGSTAMMQQIKLDMPELLI